MDTKAFTEAYQTLTPAQKKAVDTVEGPVLVIAGPGTGKTHILTLRVANILLKTDAAPESILVLTFTDSAARNVAKRLAGFIGEETARKVGVYTFHSFAEEMMKRFPEAFPEHTDRRLMGEMEQVLLWRDVLESREVKHLATPRSPFHYLGDLKDLEDKMTREKLSLESYGSWLDEEAKRIEEDPSLRYVRGGKGGEAGELNPKGTAQLARLEKGREAITLIEAYRDEKEARGLYGYTDVLRIAVDALASDEVLRAELQEKYQYVLADEHQDANALQHALLDALAFDEHPNLFIVGDEKQAIFGFQGADTTHFETFLKLYPRTEVVALTDNYRSYQDMLDVSHTLLEGLPSASGEHVRLKAFRGEGGSLHILRAADPLAEREQIATMIAKAIQEGVDPKEIAVITSKNDTADLFALHLRARGIPTLRAGNIDLAGRPSIRSLMQLMQAVADPNDLSSLRAALLAPWWSASLKERSAFLQRYRDYELPEALATTFPKISETILELQKEATSIPPLNVFSRILADSGARAYFLGGAEQVQEDIPLVRQLIMHVEELARRDPNATFAEVMASFRKAREHEIGSIKTTLTQREGHVTVITAHKAKGMEFERVFVTSLTAREWEGRGKSSLVPSPFDNTREKEEVIRLFYVAMTRAKDELVLSYPLAGSEGKEITPMSLIPDGLPSIEAKADDIPLMHAHIEAPKLICELTERYLVHDGLSPSALNEYLASPPEFFAKRVLRLREPENRAIVVGNAVHAAIAAYLRLSEEGADAREAAAYAELERCLARSLLPRNETFDQLVRHSRACLASYLGSPLLSREPVAVEETFSVKRLVNGKEVVLKGKVDAVFKGEQGECIVDFKTSREVAKKDKEKFERQLAFYDLLLRANGHETTEALIVQVGEEEVTEHPVELTDATRADIERVLDEVLPELLGGKWRKGEPSDYDDLLELFTPS